MNYFLIDFTLRYLQNHGNSMAFVEEYIDLYYKEGEKTGFLGYPDNVSEAVSSIFCAADNFSAKEDRMPYEFNEQQLRDYIVKILTDMAIIPAASS